MKAKILVVDDEAHIVALLTEWLKTEGYQVLAAHSARLALELMAKKPPDLAIIDVMMPEMSGYDLLAKIKQMPGLSELPVIFLTVRSDSEDVVESFNRGGDDHIKKPFKPLELLARVKAILRRMASHSALKLEKEKLEQVLHLLPQALILLNKESKITWLNEKAQQLLRRRAGELCQKKLKEVMVLKGEEPVSRSGFTKGELSNLLSAEEPPLKVNYQMLPLAEGFLLILAP